MVLLKRSIQIGKIKQTSLRHVHVSVLTIFVFSIKLVLPEYFIHGTIMILVIFGGDWITFLLNVPLLGYHIRK
jgi:hypothetical protein